MVRRIAIVGGGIAGLTLATALDPEMWQTVIYEAQPERASGGAALGIWPSAESTLKKIGVDVPDSYRASGYGLHHISGRRLIRPPALSVGLVERALLLSALEAAVPHSVERVHEEIREPDELEADIVVGADGVRSRVRPFVAGAAAERRATPYLAVRGILRGNPTLDGEGEYWGGGLIFGRQRLSAHDTYWFAAYKDQSVREPLRPADVARDAAHRFRTAAPLIRETLADAGDDVLATRLWVAPPMLRYHRDQYVVIGDAAHASMPNLGRGACSAILDAASLARTLNAGGSLRAWQRRRVPVTQAERAAAGAVMAVAARV